MTLSKMLSRSLTAVAFVAVYSTSAMASIINFDGTGAPGTFSSTTPLTNLYAGLGVTFAGDGGSGGSILNQSGNFGFNALSGSDFLAFNTGVGTGTKQVISFANAVSNVSIWAASSFLSSTTSMSAYASNGALLFMQTITNSTTWRQLAITSSGTAISKVVLSGTGNHFAYDNLEFNVAPVPEPETYAMLLAGLGLMGGIARRRKQKTATATATATA